MNKEQLQSAKDEAAREVWGSDVKVPNIVYDTVEDYLNSK